MKFPPPITPALHTSLWKTGEIQTNNNRERKANRPGGRCEEGVIKPADRWRGVNTRKGEWGEEVPVAFFCPLLFWTFFQSFTRCIRVLFFVSSWSFLTYLDLKDVQYIFCVSYFIFHWRSLSRSSFVVCVLNRKYSICGRMMDNDILILLVFKLINSSI